MKYKVGDKVRIKSLDWYNENKTIHGDVWFDNAVFVGGQSLYCGCELTIRLVTNNHYYVIENDYYWTDEMIEGLVEEEVGLVDNLSSRWVNEFNLPEGYIFKDENGNVINATKIVLEKKKNKYPKTYEECMRILGFTTVYTPKVEPMFDYDDDIIALQKLKNCRDAYWKIAGEEMGLGEPWKPDWEDVKSRKYVIVRGEKGKIIKGDTTSYATAFAFPTKEMRDAFKENFDSDLEICKELL